jgi:hypothetical protein
MSNWMLREKNQLNSTHPLTMAFEVMIPGTPVPYRLINYDQPVSMSGFVFAPFPVDVDALEDANSMALVRLRVTIGNVDRGMASLLENYWGPDAPWTVVIWQIDAHVPQETAYASGDVFTVMQVATNLQTALVDVQAEGMTLTSTVPKRRYSALGGFPAIPRRIL